MTLPIGKMILTPRMLPRGIEPGKTRQVQLLNTPVRSCAGSIPLPLSGGSQPGQRRFTLGSQDRAHGSHGHIAVRTGLCTTTWHALHRRIRRPLMAWLIDSRTLAGGNCRPTRAGSALAVSPTANCWHRAATIARLCMVDCRWPSALGTKGHVSHVYNVAFHPRQRELASADLMGVVSR